MLVKLLVKNFAIIDELVFTPSPGFNVLTGETGAGKSIVIQAVEAIKGSKVAPELVRTGCREAKVEAVLRLPDEMELPPELAKQGIGPGDEVVLRRIINARGRSRSYINDNSVPSSFLSELGERLIHIFGQHQHRMLVDPDVQLGLLDGFAGLERETIELRKLHAILMSKEEELSSLRRAVARAREKKELLEYQIAETESANLSPGEDSELAQEREKLRNIEKLVHAASSSYEELYERQGSVLERLSSVSGELNRVSQIDPELSPVVKDLESAILIIQEAAMSLSRYAQKLDPDPRRLDMIEERLALLDRLKRKLDCRNVDEVLEKLLEMKKELESIDENKEKVVALEQEIAELQRVVVELADDLSRKRREAAGRLGKVLEKELATLGMEKTSFVVKMSRCQCGIGVNGSDIPGPSGWDRVEFTISPNMGEVPKPLSKIASGGELSRIMLAMKGVIAHLGAVPTIIFDEVDAGIGGRTAEVVGRKLRDVSRRHQVLVVTHLHQIASLADTHFKVYKAVDDGRTVTRLSKLNHDERVEELARMVGGLEISPEALAHARELIRRRDGKESQSIGYRKNT